MPSTNCPNDSIIIFYGKPVLHFFRFYASLKHMSRNASPFVHHNGARRVLGNVLVSVVGIIGIRVNVPGSA